MLNSRTHTKSDIQLRNWEQEKKSTCQGKKQEVEHYPKEESVKQSASEIADPGAAEAEEETEDGEDWWR